MYHDLTLLKINMNSLKDSINSHVLCISHPATLHLYYRYKKQKVIFILFQVLTIIGFWGIYAIPENRSLSVELDCDGGVTMLQSCYKDKASVDMCKVNSLSNLSSNASTYCQVSVIYLGHRASQISFSRTRRIS